ncbi:hypothetical protein GIS00_10225 [Nakamurella sp. YIM 132087]|uniref:Uncharacterized protein n=1 Tax=Nakamurella alba TaxID=2665158 RepID=A0A7K1FNF7_9ACTN|nr:hypothetical protein [Nakamurella alba]MTD14324.1 hypothetical protein [Nakamurella alba]
MRRTLLAGVVAALTAGLTGVLAALPAAAVQASSSPPAAVSAAPGAFGADQIVGSCISGPSAADISTDGTVRGFAACTGGAEYGPISYFRQQAGGTLYREDTPWTGEVLATAWDGVDAMYVVFEDEGMLRIAKRTSSTGAYSATTLLSFDSGFQADVVASNGKWWAVWSRPAGSGMDAPVQLFQAHTLLGTQAPTQITHTPPSITNTHPSLTYRNGRVTLIWSRGYEDHSDLRMANSTGGPWASFDFATFGTDNDRVDSINYNGILYTTWQRDGKIVVADNSTGAFVSHTFVTGGRLPRIGHSGGKTFLAWTTGSGINQKLLFTERSGGVWSSVPVGGFPGVASAVLGQGGKARILYYDDERLHLRSQL